MSTLSELEKAKILAASQKLAKAKVPLWKKKKKMGH